MIFRKLAERRDIFSSNFVDPNRIPRNSEGYGSYSGVSVTPSNVTNLSAVFAAVRLVSQTVASLPVGVFRKSGTSRMELVPPAWITHPNPDNNWFEFIEQTMVSLLLWGNAYIYLVPDGDGIGELWVLDPDKVRIEYKAMVKTYIIWRDGRRVELGRDQVVHIRGTSRPGCPYGMSPIDEAAQSFGLALAAEQFGSRFFGAGGTMSGVVEIPTDPGQDALTRMAIGWKKAHQGVVNAHEPGFLVGGATWKATSVPNDSAQFLETRKFQVSEIARWFGVPAHKIGDLDHATFSNIEHMAIEFVTDCIRPWLVRLESAFNPLLGTGFAPTPRFAAYLRFNVDGLLRGDAAGRAAFYNTMRNIGAFNADEIRSLEEKEPIPDGLGQIYWQPSNVAPAGTTPAPPPSANGSGTPSADAMAALLAGK